MEGYKNLAGNSGVSAYEIGAESITVGADPKKLDLIIL